jgi:hypothetical protein
MMPSRLEDKRSKRNVPPLAEHYSQQGCNVFSHAFIFGALGRWNPANWRIINHLRLRHNYCRLMSKVMVLDAIQWSHNIYIEHLLGVRQYQQDTGGSLSG